MNDVEFETAQPYLVQFMKTVTTDYADCQRIAEKYGEISVRLIIKEMHLTNDRAIKMLNRYQSIQDAKEMHRRPRNDNG